MKKLILFFLFIPNLVFAGSMKMIGEKGKPSEVTRTITIKMYDNYFEPAEINVKKDETIKFIVLNVGELVHEFNIATKEMHIKHQKYAFLTFQRSNPKPAGGRNKRQRAPRRGPDLEQPKGQPSKLRRASLLAITGLGA